MVGGIGEFVSGLEELNVIQLLSSKLKADPALVLRRLIIGSMACAVVIVIVLLVGQNHVEARTHEIEAPQEQLVQESTRFEESQTQSVLADAPQTLPSPLVIYITGCVVEPGVYSFEEGERIQDAVNAAGGLTAEAAGAAVNLAQTMSDGMQIHIPSRDEVSVNAPLSTITESERVTSDASAGTQLVNINTADVSLLQTLEGIGPATAQKIIDYRTAQGPFKHIEDLLQVSGIGDKKFAAIKAYITV